MRKSSGELRATAVGRDLARDTLTPGAHFPQVFNKLVVSKSPGHLPRAAVARARSATNAGKRSRTRRAGEGKGKKQGKRRESEAGFVEVCRAAGCLIERGFPWARVDISVNEAFPRKRRRRALVWRGPSAPMGLRGKGAGAQHRYTIERRYQRFLDLPWRIHRVF